MVSRTDARPQPHPHPGIVRGELGGPGIHLRGNIEGFMNVASKDKWLSMHVGTHWDSFYLPEYVAIQKRFFDHFLKGEDNGWQDEPRVQLAIRRPDKAPFRMEEEFPLARTQRRQVFLEGAPTSL